MEVDKAAAVDAFMADPTLSAFLLGADYTIDFTAAVAGSPFTLGMLDYPEIKPQSKWSALRRAILLSRPTKV